MPPTANTHAQRAKPSAMPARASAAYSAAAPAPPGLTPDPNMPASAWTPEAIAARTRRERPGMRPFAAEIDIAELDDQLRAVATWPGKSKELSRSTLIIGSRRMIHTGKIMLVAVHLIDSEPVPLMGRVSECAYEGYSMHRIVLDLVPLPESAVIQAWLSSRPSRR
jgi:hypothetical protein